MLLLLSIGNRDQVAERTLFLWNNEHLVSKGCFSRAYTHSILPVIYGEPNIEISNDHADVSKHRSIRQNVKTSIHEFLTIKALWIPDPLPLRRQYRLITHNFKATQGL